MQSRTVPESQARAADTVLAGVMALPSPHRFDVYIAVGGLLGGLLLVGLGLATRPATDPVTLFDGPGRSSCRSPCWPAASCCAARPRARPC